MDNFLERPTLEGAGGQTDDTRSTFRPPLKLWGITAQTSYWEDRSVGTRADTFFGVRTRKSVKNGTFL